MQTAIELRNKLKSIDHRGYPAYKELRGQYDFKDYVLSIDHVQGDPFAAPSRLSVRVKGEKAGFPPAFYDTHAKRVTLQDHLTRLFGREVSGGSFQAKGSGKSGLLSVSRCGQQVLERTALRVNTGSTAKGHAAQDSAARTNAAQSGTNQSNADRGDIILRFEAGFPANGRTINARELEKMLFDILPECVRRSLYYARIDKNKLKQAICLCEDQEFIREKLPELSLCAFIADGAILPRESGISEKPMKGAVPFKTPDTLKVTLDLPNRGSVSGMGIPKGVTLFVGGGYHGKSTILQALQNGVYNHIYGDGREFVITDRTAVKLRAEDGRSIANVDISPFIKNLPSKRDTAHFSTEDASGSTSQAANLMEGVEAGSSLFLIDEDTSATNFMIRDQLMQEVISAGEEPITPFICRVNSLYRDLDISSIIVAGSSGAYFHVADTVIQMKEYVTCDITKKAKEAAMGYPAVSGEEDRFPDYVDKRCPQPDMGLRKDDRIKIKTMGTSELMLSKENVELRYLEQLKDQEQSAALAWILKFAELKMMDGRKNLKQMSELLEKQLDRDGLESLFERGDISSSLARPRKQEILACINRYRRLRF
ncbi:ABC-ATPase domain-containing protein [Parablautia muri]|uniref:Isopentenyl-diphosphate delta-isomerase n=1 Tax=Parablautia muri TaxID=2320879 RepID=A0A9X5BHB0_9FIRM|nr:ABC-ATPase domain-containing protein [Parablautia muri]NBJ94096.1 isopentenyl-diphosphate delta-isomerase [Parablautia muri]